MNLGSVKDCSSESQRQDIPAAARYWPRNLLFFVGLILSLTVWFELFRIALMLRNHGLLAGAPATDLLRALLIGLRFDLSTACLLLAPVALFAQLPLVSLDRSAPMRALVFWMVLLIVGIGSLLMLAEMEFVREFQVRYNQLALAYLDQSSTVGGMIWKGYPVIRYILVWIAAMVIFAVHLRWMMRRIYALSGGWRVGASAWQRRDRAVLPITARNVVLETGAVVMVAAALIIGVRGGLQHTPLRWGDAFKSESDIVNQMSLNGLYTLSRTVADTLLRHDASEAYLNRMPLAEAEVLTRNLVVSEHERLLEPEHRTVLRKGVARDRVLNLKPNVRPNVVLVLMESFSGQFCGACGGEEDFTPEFSRLAREGILFNRCFSIGNHTHQGVFGTLLSFPNLPGYEALMQTQAANQKFTSLPQALKDAGYETMFLYNGSFAWDNMQGFFRKQGVNRFIGRDQFDQSIRRDAVWGVDDAELFARANQEFETAAKNGPFFGIILTLSNHAPWDLPHLPFEPTADRGPNNKPIDGLRYADWCVGRFMDEAKTLSYFKNTLFVFIGDHGSRVVGEKVTAAAIQSHHVPLLLLGPEIIDSPPHIDSTLASQLNVAPTIVGLLGLDAPRDHWGRDLFSAETRRESVAVFKGSGGDNAMAIARGDQILVVDEAGQSHLYKYALAPRAQVWPVEDSDPAIQSSMRRELDAVIQTALDDLRSGHHVRPVGLKPLAVVTPAP